MPYRSRVHGCLLGGAVGDALGAPLEFISDAATLAALPMWDDVAFMPVTFGSVTGHGLITDDTQMTLFTVEGLIRAQTRFISRGICHPPSVLHHAYLRWLTTQERTTPPLITNNRGSRWDGWFMKQPWLYSRRAPGRTCLAALQASRAQGTFGYVAQNTSKGCGAVMRSAPIGLVPFIDHGAMAIESAAITHGHPTGQVASGALAVLIAALTDGKPLSQALDTTEDWLAAIPDAQETLTAIRQARSLAAAPWDSSTVNAIGQGWVAEEALAIAVYAASVYPDRQDFTTALVVSVAHPGDSDSTGAICGNILGTLHGVDAIPPHLLGQLEGRADIEQLADDLITAFTNIDAIEEPSDNTPGVIAMPSLQQSWTHRYPGF